jgi:ectoine hydroxylase-related dioxygenase (phytanoyl-CoA dioxygenase family)
VGVAESVDITEALQREGFAVLRRLVPRDAIDVALRHLHADVLTRGLPQEWISDWQWVSKNWFPHLRWDREIVQLSEYLPESLRDGWPCEPQILLAFPDTGDPWELTPHVDAPPEWAGGKGYRSICGVALTPSHARNGGLVVWPFNDGGRPYEATLEPGDVIVMHPQLPHTAGFNATAEIRYAIYFRYVERDDSTSAEQPTTNAS